MKKILIGLIVCITMSVSATVSAEPTLQKQFLLSRASYPIYINGVEYKDEQLPALNYEGKTYIPLSKIGDILGVEYRWNAEKNRVEIGGLIQDNQKTTTNVNHTDNNGPNGNNQYLVTKASYPIFVNGVEYKDEQFPALNLEGKTYIPLSKIGDILGVEYRWNAEKGQVEIGSVIEDYAESNGLYATEGTGKFAGYMMLHGYPGQDKYQIYFQGDANRYHTTIEDLRGINLNERITWKYNGNSYTHSRTQLYVFFADTSWFRNNLTGINQYTLTGDWFLDVFGDVYLDWAEGIGYSSDAERWVDKYFRQSVQNDPNMPFVTLTPDSTFIPVEEIQPENPSIEEVIRDIEKLNSDLMTEEEKQFHANWIGKKELEEKHGIEVTQYINSGANGFSVELWFRKYQGSNGGYETIYKIYDFKMSADVEKDQVVTNNGLRYRYFDGIYESGMVSHEGGVFFHREDLKNLGIIS